MKGIEHSGTELIRSMNISVRSLELVCWSSVKCLSSDERKSPVLGVSGEISADVLHWSKVSRLPGLQGAVSSGGEDLLVTEVARIYEALGREPSLSEHFFWTGLASRVIMEHGTAWVTVSSSSLNSLRRSSFRSFQENYSSSLSSGDLTATLCFTEPAAGSDLRSIENLAKFDPDSETYHLKAGADFLSQSV